MDEKRFDDLTRALADRPGGTVTRRFALKAAAALALGAFGLRDRAGAKVAQAQCGNVSCRNNPGRCNPGCVCCVYGNGNTRCTPPGGCSGTPTCPAGTVVDPAGGCVAPTTTTTPAPTTTSTTVAPTTSTTVAPTTTTTPPTTTTTTTTPPPATCRGSCNDRFGEPCPSGCVCDSPINGTCVTATTPPPLTCFGTCNPRDGSGCASGCLCSQGICVAKE